MAWAATTIASKNRANMNTAIFTIGDSFGSRFKGNAGLCTEARAWVAAGRAPVQSPARRAHGVTSPPAPSHAALLFLNPPGEVRPKVDTPSRPQENRMQRESP